MGIDVVKAVKHIFLSGRIQGGRNTTHICLIPKTHNPIKVEDFHPITSCNLVYKVISKVLANRLIVATSTLVSSSQNAFLLGRYI